MIDPDVTILLVVRSVPMRIPLKPPPWLPLTAALALGCFRSSAPGPSRAFQDPGPPGPPTSCESRDEDDVCTRCQRRSCCNEIAACDSACQTWFVAFQSCLYPTGIWAGFGTAQCKLETNMVKNPAASALAASALVDCFSAECATDEWCGAEPRAVFTFPPPNPEKDFSSAEFLEKYCNGCHSPGKVGPMGDLLTQFTSNARWVSPMDDPNWFIAMDYATVAAKTDIILCGVRDDYLPTECATLPSVRPGFFTKPAKFPPSGIGGYASCPDALPSGGCPQPSSFERARLMSWIADGAPR